VYELNASDARSAGAVTDTIKMALESASLKDARPTCLVVDEIDGATGGGMSSGAGGEESRGFIKALVDLVEGGKGGRKAKGAKGSKGKKSKPLLRPIICICNDLYAPALRPLRPYCRLIRFQKPATNHLVTRLKSICEAEGISASSRCLSLLSALSQGDIRSCLNVLQLAKLRSLRKLAGSGRSDGLVEVTEAEIREAGVGVKDGSTNLQTVWSALFKTPSPKERARKTAPYEGPALTQHLISLVQSSGDYNRLLQGCFEHYPNLSFVDDGWWRIRSMLDWVAWGNELQDKAWSNGTFDLMGYVPWSFVKWNGLFANTVNSLPEWPKVDYEQFLKKQAFEEISVELHHSLPPSLRVQFGRDAVVRELGPTLMRMLTPDLKPINNQIVRPAERATMGSLVNIMLHLSLNFAQERTDEGVLTYRLEPPLEVFTSYDGKKSAAVNVGRYAVRAIVMRELEAERARRRNGIVDGTPGEASSSSAKNALEAYRKADANGLGLMGKKDKVALDFFGRPVVLKAKKEAGGASAGSSSGLKDLPAPILAARQAKEALTAGGTTSSTNALPKEDPSAAEEAEGGAGSDGHRGQKRLKVHYRHNEGYSNAVRQPIKMSALL
jgi:chromosome transmission fidelity protein 18